jgi:hypothetical protein
MSPMSRAAHKGLRYASPVFYDILGNSQVVVKITADKHRVCIYVVTTLHYLAKGRNRALADT